MTYFQPHIFTMICDYCNETIEQKQRRLWSSIGCKREEYSNKIICKVYTKQYGSYNLNRKYSSYIKLLTCIDRCGLCDLDGNLQDLCRKDSYWRAIREC